MGVAASKAGMAEGREEVPSACPVLPTSSFALGAVPEPPEGGTPNAADAQEQTCETKPMGRAGSRLGCFHGVKTVVPLWGGRAIVQNEANWQEAARYSPSGPSRRGARQTPRQTKPIGTSRRVRRATRAKRTQLAHARIAATRSLGPDPCDAADCAFVQTKPISGKDPRTNALRRHYEPRAERAKRTQLREASAMPRLIWTPAPSASLRTGSAGVTRGRGLLYKRSQWPAAAGGRAKQSQSAPDGCTNEPNRQGNTPVFHHSSIPIPILPYKRSQWPGRPNGR